MACTPQDPNFAGCLSCEELLVVWEASYPSSFGERSRILVLVASAGRGARGSSQTLQTPAKRHVLKCCQSSRNSFY